MGQVSGEAMSLITLVESKSRQGGHTETTGAWPREGDLLLWHPLSASTKRFGFLGFFFVCLFVWVLFVCLSFV